MSLPTPKQPPRGRLQHQPLARRHRAQRANVCGAHYASIHMRQQAGFVEHRGGRLCHVIQRGVVAERAQLCRGLRVQQLRLIACICTLNFPIFIL